MKIENFEIVKTKMELLNSLKYKLEYVENKELFVDVRIPHSQFLTLYISQSSEKKEALITRLFAEELARHYTEEIAKLTKQIELL